jgi:hypothetical protein
MATDWRKELGLCKRIYFWYMKTGLISIPFGVIYAFVTLRFGHESMAALIVCLAAAIAVAYKIQGMPPDR